LTLEPEVSVFNTLNSPAVYAVRSFNYGTSSYLQPPPRSFRGWCGLGPTWSG